MRLTLRTLLAWIDGLLEPADRAALGDKVASSAVAPVLVERIRGVVERGPLPAPEPTARGFAGDANTAAEYLDNVLPPERIEEFERVCIDSDLHLAEVAACHQLLADAARNPGLLDALDDAGRGRLLEALRQRVADAAAVAGEAGVVRPVTRRPAPARRASAAAWLSAAAALLLLAGLGGVFVWSLSKPAPRTVARVDPPVAEETAPVTDPPAAVDAPGDAGDGAAAAEPDVAADREPAAGQPAAATQPDAAEVARTEPADTPPAEEMEQEVAIDVAIPADSSVPQGDALAIAAPAPRPRPPAPAGDAAVPAVPPRPPLPTPSSWSGVILRRGPDAAWVLHDDSTVLGPGAEVVVPSACAAEIELDGVIVRLRPATRALVSKDDDGLVRLTLESGRAVVVARDRTARIGLTAGGLVGVVESGLERPLGIEAIGRRGGGRVGRAAGVFATGPVVWRHVGPLAAAGTTSDLPAGGGLAWDDVDPATARILPAVAEPSWLADPGISRVDRAAGAVLAERLAATPTAEVLTAMTTDVRAEHRMVAAATLAVLGDYEPLARQLCSNAPRTMLYEGQWSALESLSVPLALGRGAESAAAWEAALAAAAPAGRAADLAAMSRGFDEAALAGGAAADLVAALEAGDLAVRRFAFRALREAVPDRDAASRYRPDRPPTLRRDGVSWWRGQLEQGRIGGAETPDATAP